MLVCPSREEFARTYNRQATPISYVRNHLLPLSSNMAKFLTLAQTCRDVEHPGTRLLLHRSTPAAVLLVLLLRHIIVLLVLTPPLVVVVLVVLLTPRTAAVSQISRLRRCVCRWLTTRTCYLVLSWSSAMMYDDILCYTCYICAMMRYCAIYVVLYLYYDELYCAIVSAIILLL